ncbi:YdcF family protein [Kineococcus sp. R8]|uniref:YdcF family protein n=1 Tax=Kineococcus siccus TaxID=2696567 RepID=UPI0014120BDB|nr:YdcF family protein [Kineococcus siccus]NAZ84372.1 YdcF family protein [Kineococcus siccus]
MSVRPALVALASSALAVVVGTEVLHAWASRRHFPRGDDERGDDAGRPGDEVVLVLGSPATARGDLHPVQRWRTDIAVRSLRGRDGRFVFSGGAPDGRPGEAEVMAAYAHEVLGVPRERIALETRSRSTWENVAFSVPLLEGAGTLRIASAPTHAARARRYLARQRPDLALLLAPADDYRVGERLRWKAASLAYGAARRAVRRWRRRTPGAGPGVAQGRP